MRTARGLFEALGAGLPLVALLACAVLGVTVAVGMRGWPGTGVTPGLQRLGAPATPPPTAPSDPTVGSPGNPAVPRIVSAAMPPATARARRAGHHRARLDSAVHR